MALIGYARVSTRDQNPEGQTDVLSSAGCEKLFVDRASGTLAKRPALTEALGYLRAGDTLVVTKLDRLGRSVKNLKEISDQLQEPGDRFEGSFAGDRYDDPRRAVVLPHARCHR